MNQVKYVKVKYVLIFNDGASLDMSINIKNDGNFNYNKEFFKKSLLEHRNVREVRC